MMKLLNDSDLVVADNRHRNLKYIAPDNVQFTLTSVPAKKLATSCSKELAARVKIFNTVCNYMGSCF